jgi:hypothetical protein
MIMGHETVIGSRWQSAALRRRAKLSEEERSELERLILDPAIFNAVLDEDLAVDMYAIDAAKSEVVFDDEYGKELDAQIREDERATARSVNDGFRRLEPKFYIDALEDPVRFEARFVHYWALYYGGEPPALGLISEIGIWIGLAVGSGILGNAAYDLLTSITKSFRTRWKERHKRRDVEALAGGDMPTFSQPQVELLPNEAESLSYLALSVIKRSPCEMEVKWSGHSKDGWELVVVVEKELYFVSFSNGDPLFATVKVDLVDADFLERLQRDQIPFSSE